MQQKSCSAPPPPLTHWKSSENSPRSVQHPSAADVQVYLANEINIFESQLRILAERKLLKSETNTKIQR